jgi:hypothetical protein
MNKRYAIIENGIVANIVAAASDPSSMTDLLCVEVDDTIQPGYIYDGTTFIENTNEEDEQGTN